MTASSVSVLASPPKLKREQRLARWLRLLGLACAVLTGCGVDTLKDDRPEPPRNICKDDTACGPGSCVNGRCEVANTKLRSLLLEITPVSAGSPISGVPFLKRWESLVPGENNRNLDLDFVARVSGNLTMQAASACKDAKIPIRVLLIPSERLLGLSTENYSAKGTLSPNNVDVLAFKFELGVPSGEYDLYVEPTIEEAAAPCALAPLFYRRLWIEPGNVSLTIPVPAPQELRLEVRRLFGHREFDNWTAEMIDPVSLRALSNRVKIKRSATGEYSARLVYLTVVGEARTPGQELIRLTPPPEVLAPSVQMARATLGVWTPGLSVIDVAQTLPNPVTVEGQVGTGGNPQRVTVTLQAISLEGVQDGLSLAYSQTRVVEGGIFTVSLFPGRYRVQAVPHAGSGLATTLDTWDIGRSPASQAGKLVEVLQLARITGTALTPDGRPATQASIRAVNSPASLDEGTGTTKTPLFVPRTSPEIEADVRPDDGTFELKIDPGTFDISIRAAEGTGFAWFVKPQQRVERAGYRLGEVAVELPVVYRGVVSVPSLQVSSVPGALIRAYVYMDKDGPTSDPSRALGVLQVAETRADSKGQFELLLPAGLNQR